MVIVAALAGIAVLYAVIRYSFLLPSVSGIPVLMYHKVSPDHRDFLTVTASDLDAQFEWMTNQGYQNISMSLYLDFLEGRVQRSALPQKPFVVTFDDGYESNLVLAMPILKRYRISACLFVTTSFIQNKKSVEGDLCLSESQLHEWVRGGMELGLHSHDHPNYRNISQREVLDDLAKNRGCLNEWKLPYLEVLAYPFGARPKDPIKLSELKAALTSANLRAAFRIGNRIHSEREIARGIDRMDLCRIDVRGDDPFFEFKIKIKKGHSKLL